MRQLHLNLFIHSRGHHEASWRHPASSPLALTDIRYYQDLTQRAEKACFDSVFFADQLALAEDVAQAARAWLEPVTLLAAIAISTTRILNLVRCDRLTLRQLLLYLAGARGHFLTAGTAEQIADLIENWFRDRAADGFNIMPPLLPAQLDVFAAEVIPLLQRRGLFRRDYEGPTLRNHYRLPQPESAFAGVGHP